jgi:hypothetical protein
MKSSRVWIVFCLFFLLFSLPLPKASASALRGAPPVFALPQSGGPVFEMTGALPNGVVNLHYGTTLFINGGQGPFTFSITMGNLPAGLSLDPASGHISGTPTTAGTSNFTVKVTDSLNATATGNFSILINPVPVSTAAQLALLSGRYAILFRGTSDPSVTTPNVSDAIGSFNFDGKGNFTAVVDSNKEGGNPATQCNLSGTYSVGADNRGLLTFAPVGSCVTGSIGGGGGTLAFVLGDVKSGVAATGRLINFDDNSGNSGLGAGLLRRQDPNAFASASFAGTYGFGLTGQDASLGRAVEAGLVTFNNSLAITGGNFDLNDNGTLFTGTTTGSYTAPDANGRTVLTTTVPGLGTFTSVVYIISANEFFFLSLDPTATNILFAGQGERQFNPNSFDLTSLKGPDVVTASGTSSGGTSALAGVATASIVNNVGNISITADIDDGGNLTLGQVQNGTYTVAANGRVVLTGFSSTAIIAYLIRPDRAFLIGQDHGDPPFGEIEPQIGGPFSASPFANNMIIGQNELVPGGSSDISGVAVLAPSNTLNATVDESHSGGDLKYGETQILTYTVDPTGHFKAQTGDGSNLAGYLVSQFKVAVTDTTGPTSDPTPSSHPQLTIVQSIPQAPGAPSPTTTTVNFTTPVPVGSNAQSAPVTFSNAGVGPLTIQTLTNATDFSAAGTCVASLPVALAPGQSCQVVVTFAPGASTPTNTLLNEMITIATDAGNITITATGTAVSAGINFAPGTTINFNNVPVGSNANQTLTVTNSGAVALTISTIVLGGTNAGDFKIQPGVNDCTNGTMLQQNQSCVLPLTFTPGAAGPRTATITFTDNSPAAGSMQIITLQGSGTAPATPTISLSTNSVNFGGVMPNTTSPAQTVTVTNTGLAPLHISNVSITPNQTEFTIVQGSSSCLSGAPVQPNGNCTISITFTPPSTNVFNATVTITSDASNGTQMISLTGSGNTVNFTLNTGPGSGTSVTINPGDTAVFLFNLSSVNGFTGTVNLSCASQQPTITCSIMPSSVNLGPGVTATMITVKTSCSWLGPRFAPFTPLHKTRELVLAPLGLLMALAMLLAVTGIRRQKLRLVSSLAALALFAMSFAGCASVPHSPSGATPPGTYNLVITASAPGSASQSITITLKVL